jgi:hypothetical protein
VVDSDGYMVEGATYPVSTVVTTIMVCCRFGTAVAAAGAVPLLVPYGGLYPELLRGVLRMPLRSTVPSMVTVPVPVPPVPVPPSAPSDDFLVPSDLALLLLLLPMLDRLPPPPSPSSAMKLSYSLSKTTALVGSS